MNVTETSKLTNNFTLKEYAYGIFQTQVKKYNEDVKLSAEAILHAQCLQEFRDYYGKAMTVNAWFRGAKFNKSVGGTANSGHLLGTATDVSMKITEATFKTYWKKWQEICKKHNTIGAMGYYPNDNFVHFESYVKWSKTNTYWKKVNGKMIYSF